METSAVETTAGKTEWPRDWRECDTLETVLISLIERSSRCQLRVHLVRMLSRRGGAPFTFVSVGRWFKPDGADAWRTDAAPWKGGPLLKTAEVKPVAVALHRALEAARARGWTVR